MSKLKNIIGQKFGRLLVLERVENYIQPNGRKRTRYKCQCDCGKIYVADGQHLIHGDVISCGCLKNEKAAERCRTKKPARASAKAKFKDLTGKRFGKLVVVEYAGQDAHSKTMWKCKCDCGRYTTVRANHLLRNLVKSCGCTNSYGEAETQKLLSKYKLTYATEYSFPDLLSSKGNPLRFDFAVFDSSNKLLALIEYQGVQHDKNNEGKEFGKQQREETDQLKYDYCKAHSIPLYYIWYKDNIEFEILSIICEIFGKTIPCQAPFVRKV